MRPDERGGTICDSTPAKATHGEHRSARRAGRQGRPADRADRHARRNDVRDRVGARARHARADANDVVVEVQRDLYRIMAELAFTAGYPAGPLSCSAPTGSSGSSALTDRLSDEIELPRQFIVPGDTVAGAALDVARTVVRRAERQAVALAHAGPPRQPGDPALSQPALVAALHARPRRRRRGRRSRRCRRKPADARGVGDDDECRRDREGDALRCALSDVATTSWLRTLAASGDTSLRRCRAPAIPV